MNNIKTIKNIFFIVMLLLCCNNLYCSDINTNNINVISIDFYKTSFNKIDSNIINESTSTQDIETIQDNAKDGDIKAMVALANLYYEGKHIEQSYKKSFKWYQKSAKQGNFDAQYYLSDMYYNGIGTKQNYKQAFEWCKKSAEQGNSDAQYTLACMYYNGEGIDKDFQKAFELCEKSAEQNNSHAQSWLANIYFRKFFDSGLKSDYDKTIEYLKTLKAYPLEELKIFENLTEKEITIALADMYYNGQGSNQVKNYKKAFEIYKKLAEQGNSKAQYNLAQILYANANEVDQDLEKALYWYQKSAEQGNSDAQFNLGYMYHQGIGVDKNLEKTIYWYQKSAEQNNFGAKNNLAQMYEKGEGVKQNYTKAFEIYKKLAEHGDSKAQYNLANMYYYGNGIKKNYIEAFKWYRKAQREDTFAQEKIIEILKYDDFDMLPLTYEDEVYIKKMFSICTTMGSSMQKILNSETNGKISLLVKILQVINDKELLLEAGDLTFYGQIMNTCEKMNYYDGQLINICGIIKGNYKYVSLFGAKKTVPKVKIYVIEKSGNIWLYNGLYNRY